MARKSFRIAPDAIIEDVDLDEEPLVLPSGQVLDEKAAAEYGKEVAARAATRRRGRPSLTAPGVHSPKVSSRVTPELRAAIDEIAEREGLRPAEVVRRALEDYVAAHR